MKSIKMRVVFIVVILVVVIGASRWFGFGDYGKREDQLKKNAPPASTPSTPLEARATLFEKHLEKIYKTEFEFFGVVVDMKGQPVAGAKVKGSIRNHLPTGTPYSTISDEVGRFAIKARGASIFVRVMKSGYYRVNPDDSSEPSSQGFDLTIGGGAAGLHRPDVANPVVFRLREAGNPVELQGLISRPNLPRDGSPVETELAKESGLMMGVSCLTLEGEKRSDHRYDWRCDFSVIGGGIQKMDDPLAFVAPTEGYETSAAIDMPRTLGGNQWLSSVSRNYWLRFADGTYGRVMFSMYTIGDHFAVIEGFRNPTPNETNLEPTLGTSDPVQNRVEP